VIRPNFINAQAYSGPYRKPALDRPHVRHKHIKIRAQNAFCSRTAIESSVEGEFRTAQIPNSGPQRCDG